MDFLRESCGDDAALIEEINKMLIADEQSISPIDHIAAFSGARALMLPSFQNRRIGPYLLEDQIGGGGMGVVYKATRTDDAFHKQVAVKIIQPHIMNAETLRRFRQERQILAGLDHPNIARVLDGGNTQDGLPYLVMEYIDGIPIQTYSDEHELDPRARLQLFHSTADAVAYAQRHFIVHRDLKPSNILVTKDGRVKLLDFGVAKLLTGAEDPTTTLLTHAGLRLMTPAYASPQQVLGQPVTTASDVYSLGIILFELLTGRRPYELVGKPLQEVLRIVCDQDVSRPSASLCPEYDTSARRKMLSGELDSVVLKALAKDPSDRYSSAEQFAEDVHRYLAGFPVVATVKQWGTTLFKFAKRHKGAVGAAVSSIGALVFGLLLALYYANVARRAGQASEAMRQKAIAAEKRADAASRLAEAHAAEARSRSVTRTR